MPSNKKHKGRLINRKSKSFHKYSIHNGTNEISVAYRNYLTPLDDDMRWCVYNIDTCAFLSMDMSKEEVVDTLAKWHAVSEASDKFKTNTEHLIKSLIVLQYKEEVDFSNPVFIGVKDYVI